VQNVYQLHGGIQQYMTDFPEGGYFKGKNFVYDPRIAVPYAEKEADEPIGHCMRCDILYDDYSSQQRCHNCRILVLLCPPCRGGTQNSEFKRIEDASDSVISILCERCS
jgi:predicted sulfurtransferase